MQRENSSESRRSERGAQDEGTVRPEGLEIVYSTLAHPCYHLASAPSNGTTSFPSDVYINTAV